VKIYSKGVLAGCAGSVLFGIVYLLISFARTFSAEDFDGWGGVVTVEFKMGPLLMIVLLAGFATGFFWMMKRSSRPVIN
jgi:hypothetical protein